MCMQVHRGYHYSSHLGKGLPNSIGSVTVTATAHSSGCRQNAKHSLFGVLSLGQPSRDILHNNKDRDTVQSFCNLKEEPILVPIEVLRCRPDYNEQQSIKLWEGGQNIQHLIH